LILLNIGFREAILSFGTDSYSIGKTYIKNIKFILLQLLRRRRTRNIYWRCWFCQRFRCI